MKVSICPDSNGWAVRYSNGIKNQTIWHQPLFDHSNTRLVRYSDPHCRCFESITTREKMIQHWNSTTHFDQLPTITAQFLQGKILKRKFFKPESSLEQWSLCLHVVSAGNRPCRRPGAIQRQSLCAMTSLQR